MYSLIALFAWSPRGTSAAVPRVPIRDLKRQPTSTSCGKVRRAIYFALRGSIVGQRRSLGFGEIPGDVFGIAPNGSRPAKSDHSGWILTDVNFRVGGKKTEYIQEPYEYGDDHDGVQDGFNGRRHRYVLVD
jgi:hypothetical protein